MRRATVILLLCALALGGCTTPFSSDDDATETPPTVDVGADISSGCWNASQRTLPLADADGETVAQQWSEAPALTIDPAGRYVATVVTNLGSIELELFPAEAPKAVNNFVCLARAGFYEGVIFHRVVPGFVIQAGDPTGTGTGGPGYRFDDEPVTRPYLRGTLAMANAGADTNGSQFFICLEDVQLPPSYTVFGQVASGLETIDAIAAVPLVVDDSGNRSRPEEPVRIESITIGSSDASTPPA